MIRVTLLAMLFIGAGVLFAALHFKPAEEPQDPLADWDMRQEIQEVSDTERNPWKRQIRL